MPASTRYTEGLARLEKIDGEAGRKVIDSLQDIALRTLPVTSSSFRSVISTNAPASTYPNANWRPSRR